VTVKIGHLIVPTAGMDADLGFYSGFGLTTRFRDSDAYAAVTDGTVTIGLAGEVEQPLPGRTLLTLQVEDIAAEGARLRACGVEVGPVQEGAHELRVLVSDPSGNPVLIYQPRS